MSPQGGIGGGPAKGGGEFPALGVPSQRLDGRFLVIKRTDAGKSLDEVSPFLIDRSIRNCSGEVSNVKRIRDGKLLVQTKSDKQAKSLMNLKMLTPEINVEVTEHETLNECRVVISCRDLQYIEDEEILKELEGQGVKKLYRISKKDKDGKMVRTTTFILTLSTPKMPTELKIGFIKVTTRPYYPRPLRCHLCFEFGHPAKFCRNEKLCVVCGDKFHGEQCEKPAKCINCGQNHSSGSFNCPKWNQENDMIRIRIDRGISVVEARKIVLASVRQQKSFAEVAGTGRSNGCTCKCICGQASPKPTVEAEKNEENIQADSTLPRNTKEKVAPENTSNQSSKDSEAGPSKNLRGMRLIIQQRADQMEEDEKSDESIPTSPQNKRKRNRKRRKAKQTLDEEGFTDVNRDFRRQKRSQPTSGKSPYVESESESDM